MSNQISTQTISFHSSELLTLKIEDVIYTAVKPLVEAIGLDWTGQAVKLKNNKEKFGCRDISIPTKGGMQIMICMPLKKLNGWLFSINPEKVRPDLKEKVIQYQEECFEALHNYWHFGKAERKTTVDERTGLRDAVNMLVSKKGLIYSEAYHLVHQRFNVQSIEELTSEQLPMAVEYVHKLCLEGELIIDEPKQLNNCTIKEDEEALHIIVNLFHSLNGAYEMGRILCQREKHLAQEISKQVGEHYLYNLNFPTQNALDKARKYIQAKSERIMFVKGMLSLLEEPKRIAN